MLRAGLQRVNLQMKARAGSIAKRILGEHVTALLVESAECVFLIDPADLAVGRHLRFKGSFGSGELERVRACVSLASDVLVVGGHIGTLAIPLAESSRHVTVIEANPRTFRLLEQNIVLNSAGNVSAHNVAATDANGPVSFLLSRANSGGSKIVPRTHAYKYYYDNPEEIDVRGVRLDELLHGLSFDTITMDIEGSEYRAMKGMTRLLEECSTFIVEFVPHHLRDVAGISVEEFVNPLLGFDNLYIPSTGERLAPSEFADALRRLFDQDAEDDGIMFRRVTV